MKKWPYCSRGSVWVILLEEGKLEQRWDHTERVPESIRVALDARMHPIPQSLRTPLPHFKLHTLLLSCPDRQYLLCCIKT